ncbi:MAG TPA: GNAT family N-acetyltransferase [Herpetosiphonaceae bacterium]
MPLFRRPFDRRHALARPAAPHDASVIGSLGYHAFRRYLTSSVDDVVELLPHEPTAVLEYEGKIVAVAQAGWRMSPNAWLRSVLIDGRVEAVSVLPLLIDQLHRLLPARAISSLYITLDEWSMPWLRTPLEKLGYKRIMDVLTYEKVGMDVPASGNQAVVVRRARPEDLQAVLRLDAICFATPWGKGEEILGPALISAPYFAVAEFSGEVIGYTYVTVHQAGVHAHLVRIAVSPAFQGRAVGVRLLADVVRFCHHRRIDLMTLNTQDYNVQAQRLYEWFGFRRTGEVQAVLGVEGLGQQRLGS